MTARRRISVAMLAVFGALVLATSPVVATLHEAHEGCTTAGHECPTSFSGPCCCEMSGAPDTRTVTPPVSDLMPPPVHVLAITLEQPPVLAPPQSRLRSVARRAGPPPPLHLLHHSILR